MLDTRSIDWKPYATKSGRLDDCGLLRTANGAIAHIDRMGDRELSEALRGVVHPEYLRTLNKAWLETGDVAKAAGLIERRSYEFVHFGEVHLGDPIDWTIGQPGKNNLSWQLHSLGFLKDAIRAHAVSGDPAWLAFVIDVISQWSAENVHDPAPSLLSWNDHSTALRLRTLGGVFLYFEGLGDEYLPFLRLLLTLASRHQHVLLAESFYSRGTNHGLDQANVLYQSTYMLQVLADAADIRGVARERLLFELNKSFAPDHVHIENSPEYHAVILSSALQINGVVTLLEGRPLFPDVDDFVNGALEFLAYILRPDGMYPPIGDTLLSKPKHDFKWLSKYPGYAHYQHALTQGRSGRDPAAWHKVFVPSGYAVFRGDPSHFSHAMRPHIVYKCGFLSHYHRQDDDNNVLLHALGDEWLADGGLYVHDHGVPEREYVRSHQAHNVMAPAQGVAQRRICPSPAPAITGYSVENGAAWVSGETTMFPGFVCARSVHYDGAYHVVIKDRMARTEGAESEDYHQFWQIPAEHDVYLRVDGIVAYSPKTGNAMVLKIHSGSLVDVTIANGKDGVLGMRSRAYGTLEPVTVVRATYRGTGELHAEVKIRFATVPAVASPELSGTDTGSM